MQVINSPKEMRSLALSWRSKNETIAFVPTMGALHEGHLALLREGKKHGTKLVLSIFVNPIQFGPKEDLSKYPRPIDKDLALARECGVDVVFFPTPENMYDKGYQTYVEVDEVTKGLCGEKRPGHFRGVTTVVIKLFNVVQPHVSLFGEKDYQQLIAIKRMVEDLNVPVKIIGYPIVREPDGLAMSSRNVYLSPEERKSALSLSESLKIAQKMIKNGEKDAKKVISEVKKHIRAAKFTKIDYVNVCDAENLEDISLIDRPARLILAVFVGRTRLIDNCPLY